MIWSVLQIICAVDERNDLFVALSVELECGLSS